MGGVGRLPAGWLASCAWRRGGWARRPLGLLGRPTRALHTIFAPPVRANEWLRKGRPLMLLAAVSGGAYTACSGQYAPPESGGTSSQPPLPPQVEPHRLEDDYEVLEVIGQGHFATVRRARHRRTGELVAIKQIAASRGRPSDPAFKRQPSEVQREIEIMRRIGSHRNIVALRSVYETEGGWALVMEYVAGGELFDRLVRLGAYSEKQASGLFRQVGEAIAYMHAHGVCHRDLKPENLLLSAPAEDGESDTIKVCDFGLAAHSESSQDRQGTWAYWAPECFTATRGHGREVDMWALGVILYIILSGLHPFDAPGRTDAQMRAAIQAGHVDFPSPQWDSVSGDAKSLIRQLLQVDPRKRLDAEAMLHHPWVVGQNVSTTPIRGSGRQLQEYQRAAAKWKATLLSSLHRQAAIRRQRDEGADALSERELLSDAFKAFDPHGKGYVLAQDLERVLAYSTGGHFTPHEIDQILRALKPVRTASNGAAEGTVDRIYYEDFLNLASNTMREQSRFFHAGDVIFRAGDVPDVMYLIIEGRVRRITSAPEGAAPVDRAPAQWLKAESFLHPGEYFGSSALLGSSRRHSTMVAETDVLVATVGRDDFEEMTAAALRSGESAGVPPLPMPANLMTDASTTDGQNLADGAAEPAHSRRPDVDPAQLMRKNHSECSVPLGRASPPPPLRRSSTSNRQPSSERKRRALERSLRFINLMASNEPPRALAPGEVLFREGDEADHMYIIRSGTFMSSVIGADGRRHDIGMRGRGECCGETACLSRKPLNTTVTCYSERCEVVAVPREAFLEMIRSSWDVCSDMLAVSEEHSKKRLRRYHFRRTREEVGGDDDDDEYSDYE